MKGRNDNWRNFIKHLGIFIVIMATLAIINFFATPQIPWALGPALVWGAAVAIHLVVAQTQDLPDKTKDFIRHFGVYAILMGGLVLVNKRLAIWPALIWGAAVAIHFLTVLTDEGAGHDEDLLPDQATTSVDDSQQFSSEEAEAQQGLVNERLGAQLAKALAYQAQIGEMAKIAADPKTQARLASITGQVNDWVTAIADLARRLDDFGQNSLINQDLEAVPQSIARLNDQLASEKDPAIRAALERTLTNRKNQLASLERLQQLMQQAEIQLESTLSSLGTIYSQILTDQSTNQVADYSHLSAEVEEETRLLQDHLEALAEVRLGNEKTLPGPI